MLLIQDNRQWVNRSTRARVLHISQSVVIQNTAENNLCSHVDSVLQSVNDGSLQILGAYIPYLY